MPATTTKLWIVMGRLERSWVEAAKSWLVVDGREWGREHDDYSWVVVGSRGWPWVIAQNKCSKRLQLIINIKYFRKKVSSQIFGKVPNTLLSGLASFSQMLELL